MTTTPYMSLILPDVSLTEGPDWATYLNAALTAIDAHNHSGGTGNSVPSSGLLINADFSLASYNLTTARSLRMNNNAAALSAGSDLGCIYEAGGELYFNDSIGRQIQITSGGALNAASIGAIGGDYATSTASVSYSSTSKTFTFLQAALTPALIDCGPVTVRKAVASGYGVKLQPASAIAADWTLSILAAAPASTSFLTIDSSGNMSTLLVTSYNGSQVIPATTKSVFYQSTAPTGWTRDTTSGLNDKFIRIVTAGSPGSTGGTHAASTNIGSHTHASGTLQFTVAKTDATTLYFYTSAGVETVVHITSSLSQGSGSTFYAPVVNLNTGTWYTKSGSGASAVTSLGSGTYAYCDMMIATKDAYA